MQQQLYKLTPSYQEKVDHLVSLGFQEIEYSWSVHITPKARQWHNDTCQVCIREDSSGHFFAITIGWFSQK